jgi:hypothetical protein
MKKILLIILAVATLQNVISQNVVYGLKGGTNFSTILTDFESPLEYKYKAGFQIGVFVKFKIADNLYFQPELLYSLQGTKYDIIMTDIIQSQDHSDPLFEDNITGIKSNESNIILPLLLKYYFNEKFNFQFGPQLDYMFNVTADNIEYDGGEIVVNGKNSKSVSEFNWGMDLGAGYDFNKRIGLDLRYNFGFNRSDLGNSEFRFGNSVFQINIEYRFN